MNALRLPGAQLGSRSSTQATFCKAVSARRPFMLVRCSASQKTEDERSTLFQKAALPAAALLGAALLFAATPDEALAARSGGRVGGSGFSSRSRSAPMPSRGPSGGGGAVRNYNYYSAPPLISPYGGYGMFGGGIGFFPMMGMGSLFNVILIMFVLNVVLQTVRSFTNSSDGSKKKEDDEDERW